MRPPARGRARRPTRSTRAAIAARLYNPDLPDPDLIIRTAGEHRVSNFLLWQSAYSEMLVTETLWPDFDVDDLKAALADYASRVRRFGGRPDAEPSRAGGARDDHDRMPSRARWKPSPLMVRILSAFVFIGVVLAGLVLGGTYGVYALVDRPGGPRALGVPRALGRDGLARAAAGCCFRSAPSSCSAARCSSRSTSTCVLSLALVGGLGAFLVVPGRRQGLGRWAMGMAGALYIGMPFNYYLLLYTSQPHGLVWTAFTIFAVIASDAAALLVGSRIGRHPFFATISPKKTVEGAIAGVVAAVIVMLVGVSRWCSGSRRSHAIVLGLLVGTHRASSATWSSRR